MAQDGRWDPGKGPKKEDAQSIKDGVSGNSAEGQGAQKGATDSKHQSEPDVIPAGRTTPEQEKGISGAAKN